MLTERPENSGHGYRLAPQLFPWVGGWGQHLHEAPGRAEPEEGPLGPGAELGRPWTQRPD